MPYQQLLHAEAALRNHYAQKHGLDFGDTPLPTDQVQVDCLRVERDRQTSNKCNICRAAFTNLDQVSDNRIESFTINGCPKIAYFSSPE